MNLTFSPFSHEEYNSYLRMYKPYFIDLNKLKETDYRSKIEQSGFLVGDPNSFGSMEHAPFFICAKYENETVGLLRADELRNELYGEEYRLFWHGNEYVESLFATESGLELGVIMVDVRYQHHGIASALFAQLRTHMEKKKIQHLFSWVVSSPKNIPSLAFHEKHGFEHVATFDSKESFGIREYQSYLFYLHIT